MIYIYTLSDPISDEVRYIGITKNLKKRYREHIRESKLNNRHKSTWIRSLSELPKIDIIDTCCDKDYSFWKCIIFHFLSPGDLDSQITQMVVSLVHMDINFQKRVKKKSH